MKVLFLICLLLASSILLHAHDSLELTCKKATGSQKSYEFCITTLQVVPGSRTADVYNQTVMLMEVLKTNFTYAHAEYEELSKQSGLPNMTRQALEVCLEMYDVTDADDAISMAKRKDYYDLGIKMNGMWADVETCVESFEDAREKSPLLKVDDDAAHLTSLGMSFAELCQNN